jgi:ATP-dependent Clp protease protease subunit
MAKELLRENELIRQILVQKTGQDEEQIRKDFDRDFFMTPEQAQSYGIIDEILTKQEPEHEENGK